VLAKYHKVNSSEYNAINQEIGDVLHQVYKPKLGGDTKSLGKEIFKILDANLGTKKTPNEAKNYKKLLTAIEKYKLLHEKEIKALFSKANRFLTKESVKKEKTEIKKEI
jgi:hypothetical protein